MREGTMQDFYEAIVIRLCLLAGVVVFVLLSAGTPENPAKSSHLLKSAHVARQ
jgi:hypothetical protein